jgi:hypothetical protein
MSTIIEIDEVNKVFATGEHNSKKKIKRKKD